MKNKILPIALIIPILALVGWVASLSSAKSSGELIRLAVVGYDPRDLLAGHYLNFQVSIAPVEPCGTTPQINPLETCVCFSKKASTGNSIPEIAESYWGGDCASRPADCQIFMRGSCSGSRFESGLNRFYFPEQFAGVLKVVPPQSSVTVSMDRKGAAQLHEFYVAHKTLDQYAREVLAAPSEARP